MSYFDPKTWEHFTRDQMLEHLEKLAQKRQDGIAEKENSKQSSKSRVMVFQTLLSPLDVYCYLKARFGNPRGMQTFLKSDDSDNLFHWDYNLKAGQKNLYFVGATQEIHVWVDDDFSDNDWLKFARCLKRDFARIGKEKSEVLRGLEKWTILPNPFLATANEASEYYHIVERSLKALARISKPASHEAYDSDVKKLLQQQARLVEKIRSACIKLNILMPVMFEAFLGLLIAILVKPEVRSNKTIHENYLRSNLDVKILDLATRCNGFDKPILPDNPAMRRFWHVVNRRNDIIHGNLHVSRDGVDTVYFDGKTPLYRSGGDRIQAHWDGLIKSQNPEQVLDDYLATHNFIYDIIGHLDTGVQDLVRMLMADDSPGWDVNREIFGKLFPQHVVAFSMDGLRYDSSLQSQPPLRVPLKPVQ